jgi:hypothetical protein
MKSRVKVKFAGFAEPSSVYHVTDSLMEPAHFRKLTPTGRAARKITGLLTSIIGYSLQEYKLFSRDN